MEQSSKVNLEEHKVYVDSHKMDMVPYSIALKAVEEAVTAKQADKYAKDLEFAMQELHRTMSQLKLD